MDAKSSKVFRRGFIVWLIIIGAEVLHGILRTILLEPLTGDFRARQIAVFSGAVIILTISYLFVGWLRAADRLQLFAVGLFWLILTLGFEIILGRFVFGLSWERIGSDYDILRGGLLGFGLLILTFAPLIAAKFKRIF